MVGVGIVGYLFQPIGVVKRALFSHLPRRAFSSQSAQGGKSSHAAWTINGCGFCSPYSRRDRMAVGEAQRASLKTKALKRP